ncbi:hypothetical protein CTAYLR_003557 [Chrysophaeum taylorii]|uniref:Protein kinase domain-containing protein n=1 Tax=Chrysophaeum taylorii TaxID=2483200 RepID=A0AAD7XM57_9STRA|nr:hypothetical protein CTAYLR_003557 [Chrysophaeum taylorii]
MGYLSKAEFQGSQASIHKLGDYAVKVLRRTGGEKVIESFRQEAHILSRLKHAGACRLLAVGTALDNPCVVLEWVETDLARALDLHGKGPPHPSVEKRWPNAERLRFAVEIASALEHLHSGEAIDGGLVVIHRDIKPDNIGITVSGQVKLLDFGLAAVVEREVRGSEADETWNLTGFTGSVRYMAPEVARQSQYGTAVDIYSFAVSAWEFLSLRGVPFKNFTMLDHHNYVVKNGHRPKIPQCWDPRLAALVTVLQYTVRY